MNYFVLDTYERDLLHLIYLLYFSENCVVLLPESSYKYQNQSMSPE